MNIQKMMQQAQAMQAKLQGELDALKVDVHRAVMVSIDADSTGEGGSLDLPDTDG